MYRGVSSVPLADLATTRGLVGGPFGSSLGKKDYVASGVPVIRGQNLSGVGRFNDSDFVYVTPEKARGELSRNLALPGDVVFTQRGTLGQVGVVPTGLHDLYVVSQSQMRLRVDPIKADPLYIYYCFRSPEMLELIESRAIVTGVPHINLAILAELPIPLRPLFEQRAIADVLGALDDKIESEKAKAQMSLGLAESIYLKATVEPARSLPLREAGTWSSGGTPSTTNPMYWNGAIPWISSSSLKSFFIGTSERSVTEEGVANGTRVVPPGTVLFVVRGMSLKTEFRVGIAQREVAFGQDTKAVVPDGRIGSNTLGIALYSSRKEILSLVDEAGHGTGRLSTDLIGSLEIPLPDLADAASLEQALDDLVTCGAQAEAETRVLAELRDALLPKLLSGELALRESGSAASEAV